MKLSMGRGVTSICFLAACASFLLGSQQHSVFAQVPTFRSQSSLVLVDVLSRDPKTGLPVREFKKHDFRLFNDGKQVPLATFDAAYDTRPIVLWLVVICNEGGKIAGSAEFVGNEAMFRPAFDQLKKLDTVGVAHWCDNGETQLDLTDRRPR